MASFLLQGWIPARQNDASGYPMIQDHSRVVKKENRGKRGSAKRRIFRPAPSPITDCFDPQIQTPILNRVMDPRAHSTLSPE